MKKIDLGQMFHILANLGVLGGILLLAYELHQNNELMGVQARFNRLTINTENYTLRVENPDLAEAWQKAYENEPLSSSERTLVEAFAMRVLLVREWSYRELPESEIPVERWKRNQNRVEQLRMAFEREKGDLDPGFVQFMEENVVE